MRREVVEIHQGFLKPNKSYILSIPVELVKKLKGFAKIWTRVVLGIGLIDCELFIRPGRVPVPALA